MHLHLLDVKADRYFGERQLLGNMFVSQSLKLASLDGSSNKALVS